ncbi:hypothetical protein GYMLUDRAFT_756785 [Collybiopsis luxurians FD-317 M1]|uniref:Uncharacterized protein n=1 Tax=Collybiopsis luxurians FD-317 M1 TaxID=944289 RepID=A0A0D0C4P1_9AGAR|nr:hypothetical protein GYMLUDRAFT_756785 [Collybiopsis luxurians FD-317 M1]
MKPRTESPLISSPTVPSIPKQSRPKPSKDRALWTGEIIFQAPRTPESKLSQTICWEGILMPSDSLSFSSFSSQRHHLHHQHPHHRQDALSQGSMPLKVAMSYSDNKLSLGSFYSVTMMNDILVACHPVQEWGWLGSEREEEMDGLRRVAEFMVVRKLVVFVPIIIEGNRVGLILVYPSTLTHDLLPLSPPSNEMFLNLALYTWALGADDRAREKTRKHFIDRLDFAKDRRDPKLPVGMYEPYGEPGIKPMEGSSLSSSSSFSALSLQTVANRNMTKHAVRMLELPELVHSFLASPGDRSFALWPPADSDAFTMSTGRVPAIEMGMLVSLLREYPFANDRGVVGGTYDSSLRVVFVHVNAFGPGLGSRLGMGQKGKEGKGTGNVREMPNLAMYRAANDVRFFVYGSSDVVNPRFGNLVEEIWHIGGIVTFTPSALLSFPLEVFQRIDQLEEHEFWVCYISPVVIGMVVSIAYSDRQDFLRRRIACTAFEHTPEHHHAQTRYAPMKVDGDDGGFGGRGGFSPCTCQGQFEYEWLLRAIEEEWVSIVGAPPFPASDLQPGGNGTVIHKKIVRDTKPRRTEEWYKYSDELLSSSSTSDSTFAMPPAVHDQFPPPPFSSETQYKDRFDEWMSEMFDNDFRSRGETLEHCLQEFERVCGRLPREEWEETVRKEVVSQMDRFQLVRGFREGLRRFVVATGEGDGNVNSNFEWITADSFRFNDDMDRMGPFLGSV